MAKEAAKEKKPNKVAKWFRELFAELKKVTWPKFPLVMKKLGVVLLVVVIFLVFVTAIDLGLNELYRLLISSLPKAA